MQQILKQKIRLLNKRDENLEVIVSRRLRRLAMTMSARSDLQSDRYEYKHL